MVEGSRKGVFGAFFGIEKKERSKARSLPEVWKALPAELKQKLQNNVWRRTPHQPIPERLSLTTPSPEILKQVLTWKANPHSFLDIQAKAQPTNQRVLIQIFTLLCELEDCHILNQIRRRVLLLLIYNLAKKISSSGRLANLQHQVFIGLIAQSGLVKRDDVSAQKKYKGWRYGGARYRAFAEELDGLGPVFLLPYDVSHYE